MNIFEEILQEALKRQIEDFNNEITDEVSLKNAFDYVTKTIGIMSSLFVEIMDITSYKSLFKSENDFQEDIEFKTTVDNIRLCGSKIKRVYDMIYGYLHNGTVNDRSIEKQFIPSHITLVVNNNTHLAQTAVRNYNGQQSIEIPCEVYDLTIDYFNSAINLMNKSRNLNVPLAELANLVTIVRDNYLILGEDNGIY